MDVGGADSNNQANTPQNNSKDSPIQKSDIKLSKNTHILNSSEFSSIKEINKNTIIFKDNPNLKKGTIIVIPPNKNNKMSTILKIVDITNQTSEYYIVTTQKATLSDAISDGTISIKDSFIKKKISTEQTRLSYKPT